jgi:Fe-S-cluster containining protein
VSRREEAAAGAEPRRVSRRRTPRPRPDPWYAPGLRFECTACGKCCTNHGEFSAVYANREEREALARHFGLTREEFEGRYCEPVAGGVSFKSAGDACVFLRDGKCSVYVLRPAQCRTFPFWPELIASEDSWQRDVASFCPGAGKGPLHGVEEIRAAARRAQL